MCFIDTVICCILESTHQGAKNFTKAFFPSNSEEKLSMSSSTAPPVTATGRAAKINAIFLMVILKIQIFVVGRNGFGVHQYDVVFVAQEEALPLPVLLLLR